MNMNMNMNMKNKKFVSVPTEIEGQFIKKVRPEKHDTYILVLMNGLFVIVVSGVPVHPGDFFNMTDQNDMYVIPAKVLAKKYKEKT